MAPMPENRGYQLIGSLVINARAETAAQKPLFRDSVAARRCVIPSTDFYAWDKDKRKFFFAQPNGDTTALQSYLDEYCFRFSLSSFGGDFPDRLALAINSSIWLN